MHRRRSSKRDDTSTSNQRGSVRRIARNLNRHWGRQFTGYGQLDRDVHLAGRFVISGVIADLQIRHANPGPCRVSAVAHREVVPGLVDRDNDAERIEQGDLDVERLGR